MVFLSDNSHTVAQYVCTRYQASTQQPVKLDSSNDLTSVTPLEKYLGKIEIQTANLHTSPCNLMLMYGKFAIS